MPFMGRTLANRRRRALAKAATTLQRAYRKRRYYKRGRNRLFRKPRAGGASLIVPLKCGYQYQVAGVGSGSGTATSIPIDQEVSLQYMLNPDWFNRYHPIFDWVRINKVRIEITCPSNIGQHGVANSALYRVWSKKASTVAETPPSSNNEWLNMQNAKRSTFSGTNNAVNYFFTPAFEAPQGATIAKRLMYKRWFEMPSGPTGAIPHLGVIAHIVKMDGSTMSSSEVFNVNVTLYCQMKGIKQL